MKTKDFTFSYVEECGVFKRTIYRINDTCYIGCFEGTKEEAIAEIKDKYRIPTKTVDEGVLYIEKVEELFNTEKKATQKDSTFGFELCIIAIKFDNVELFEYANGFANLNNNRDNTLVIQALIKKSEAVFNYMVDNFSVEALIDIAPYYISRMIEHFSVDTFKKYITKVNFKATSPMFYSVAFRYEKYQHVEFMMSLGWVMHGIDKRIMKEAVSSQNLRMLKKCQDYGFDLRFQNDYLLTNAFKVTNVEFIRYLLDEVGMDIKNVDKYELDYIEHYNKEAWELFQKRK